MSDFSGDDLPSAQEIVDLLKKNRKYIIIGLGVLLAVVLVFKSYFQVEPEERAVLLRFGKPTGEVYGPGLHFKVPFIDEVHTAAVERQHRMEFGFRSEPGKVTKVKEHGPQLDRESLMLTGDLQLVHVRWSLIYKIDDIKTWLFEVNEPQEDTIRDLAMAIMRQLVGDYSLQEILTVKVRELQDKAKVLTQSALRDRVPTGVDVTELAIRNTDVPLGAKAAFDEFNRTEPDVRRQLAEAKAAQYNVTGDAELASKRAIGEAQRNKAEVQLNAEGEAAAFLEQLREYQEAPEITKQWMYLGTMQRVLDGVDQKILMDAQGQAGNTLNLLPLNEMLNGAKPRPAPAADGGAR